MDLDSRVIGLDRVDGLYRLYGVTASAGSTGSTGFGIAGGAGGFGGSATDRSPEPHRRANKFMAIPASL